jgi:hypothetical protein
VFAELGLLAGSERRTLRHGGQGMNDHRPHTHPEASREHRGSLLLLRRSWWRAATWLHHAGEQERGVAIREEKGERRVELVSLIVSERGQCLGWQGFSPRIDEGIEVVMQAWGRSGLE